MIFKMHYTGKPLTKELYQQARKKLGIDSRADELGKESTARACWNERGEPQGGWEHCGTRWTTEELCSLYRPFKQPKPLINDF